MTSETSGLGGAHLDEASPLGFTRLFSDLDSSLNVASISLLNALRLRLRLALRRSRSDRTTASSRLRVMVSMVGRICVNIEFPVSTGERRIAL